MITWLSTITLLWLNKVSASIVIYMTFVAFTGQMWQVWLFFSSIFISFILFLFSYCCESFHHFQSCKTDMKVMKFWATLKILCEYDSNHDICVLQVVQIFAICQTIHCLPSLKVKQLKYKIYAVNDHLCTLYKICPHFSNSETELMAVNIQI